MISLMTDDTIRADQAIRAKNEDVFFSGTYYWTFRLLTPSHFHLNIYITVFLRLLENEASHGFETLIRPT